MAKIRPTRIDNVILYVLSAVMLAACTHCPEKGALPPPTNASSPLILKVYQGPLNHLAAIRAGECPMHPTCSDYCRNVIEKHGVLIGWVMTIDRLMRCGRDELSTAPRVLVGGKLKTLDTVADNDFWWHASTLGKE